LGDELPIPLQEGLGRCNGCPFGKFFSPSEQFRFNGQKFPLRVGKSKPLFSKLLSQYVIFSLQISNHLGAAGGSSIRIKARVKTAVDNSTSRHDTILELAFEMRVLFCFNILCIFEFFP
jgi:hypothetical protein